MSALAGQLPPPSASAVRRLPRRLRRVLIFSAVAFGLGALLLLLGLRAFHQRYRTLDWTGFLGAAERGSLEQARGETPPAGETPRALAVPGLCVTPLRSERRGGRQVASWLATLDAQRLLSDPRRELEEHWRREGLEVSEINGLSQARERDGTLYAARLAAAPEGAPAGTPRLMIWRIRDLPAAAGHESPAPEPRALLPPLSPEMTFTQIGRPGAPGYSLCIQVGAAADAAFEALRGDLARRGWEPFIEGQVPPAMLAAMRRAMPEGRSLVFRHATAPLACHLMVLENGEGEPPGSRILLSLF